MGGIFHSVREWSHVAAISLIQIRVTVSITGGWQARGKKGVSASCYKESVSVGASPFGILPTISEQSYLKYK